MGRLLYQAVLKLVQPEQRRRSPSPTIQAPNATCTIAVTYASTGLWSSQYSWSTSSGGTPGSHAIPTSTNSVYFDANSFGSTGETFTNDVAAQACADMNWSAVTNTPTWAGSTTLSIYGSYTGGTITNSYTGTITWASTATGKTITSNSINWGSAMNFNGVGGGWTLQDNLNIGSSALTLTNGTLATNGAITITCGAFATASGTQTLTLNSTTALNCTSFNAGAYSTTINAGSSTITVTNTAAAFTSSIASTPTYYNITITGGTTSETLTGTNTVANNVIFGASPSMSIVMTLTCANLTVNGSASSAVSVMALTYAQTITGTLTLTGSSISDRLEFGSNTTTARVVTAAATSVTNCDFYYISGSGAASWNFSGNTGGSADMGGNVNLTLTETVYWVGGSGNLSAGWSGVDGGIANPDFLPNSPSTNAIIDANSGMTAGSHTITENTNITCKDLNFTGASYPPTLANGSYFYIYGNLTLISGMSVVVNDISFYNIGTSTITTAGVTIYAL